MKQAGEKKIIMGILCVVMIGITTSGFLIACQNSKTPKLILSPYFSYKQEQIAQLSSLNSNHEMNMAEVYQWEERAFELVAVNKISSSKASKIYAYLMTAQMDAAFLSFNSHKKYMGDLDVISTRVLCEFFPKDCLRLSALVTPDAYSDQLASTVMEQVKIRMDEDEKTTKPYARKVGDEYWATRGVAKGKSAGSWKPWIISSVESFRLPPPFSSGSMEEREQLELVRVAYSNLVIEQKRAIAKWATGPGTKRGVGLWLKVFSDYTRVHLIGFEKTLRIRSNMAMGLADVYIAASDSKYIYWAQRPFMRDASIQTYMPTPNHPSYPSNHAAISGFSERFLSRFFPEEKEKWETLSEQAQNSRIWSGIHFPQDIERGSDLGKRIADVVIEGNKPSI